MSAERMLFVANGVDVPQDVQAEVMRLLQPYDPDCYEKAIAQPLMEVY